MALELGERIGGVKLFSAVAVYDLDAISAGFNLQERIGGEKAVAADLLAADDAFEETSARTRVEQVKGGNGRERVGDQTSVNRDEVRTAGEASKGVEVGVMGHKRLLIIPGHAAARALIGSSKALWW